ncbi:hypothetical protein E5288_WYG007042 [Bos mutus]|uniref:Uncharacterized protein n=1 Tax=Bos mutus TaxID=72004 RepID=A0A6B0QPG6_9CETA|nr:hypothetical protein [Bos mutus]
MNLGRSSAPSPHRNSGAPPPSRPAPNPPASSAARTTKASAGTRQIQGAEQRRSTAAHLRYLPGPPRGSEQIKPAHRTHPFRVRSRTLFRPTFPLPSGGNDVKAGLRFVSTSRERKAVFRSSRLLQLVIPASWDFGSSYLPNAWQGLSGDAARPLSTRNLARHACRPDGTTGML